MTEEKKPLKNINYKELDKIQDILVKGSSGRFQKQGHIIVQQSRLVYEYIENKYGPEQCIQSKPASAVSSSTSKVKFPDED